MRAPYTLLHYGEGGRRSEDFQRNPERERILIEYRRLNPYSMCANGCGDVPNVPIANPSQFQEGMVLAETLYAPSRYTGRATGMNYDRAMFMRQQIWAWPQDVEADPDSLRKIFVPESISPNIDLVRQLALEAFHTKGVSRE